MTASTATDLPIVAGLPFARRVRIVDGKNIWPSLTAFEVRSQIRASYSPTSALKFDLTPFLTPSFDANDIAIDLAMTGGDTLAMLGGKYDLVVSDVGITDARGIRALYGTVQVTQLATAVV